MAIVIRHNGALNNAAAGLAAGVSQGYDLKQRQQALDQDDKRAALAEKVAAAELKIRAEDEKRRAEAFEIQKGREADRKSSATALAKYATGGDEMGPAADPIEEAINQENGRARRIAEMLDPETVPAFIELHQQKVREMMLTGMRDKELSAWQSFGRRPMAEGPGAEQAAQRMENAMGALQGATTPEAMTEAIKLSNAARRETLMSEAKSADNLREVTSLTGIYQTKLGEMEAALPGLPPDLRSDMQDRIKRASLAIEAYRASSSLPGGMTANMLHSKFDEAMGGTGTKARGGKEEDKRPAWERAREMALEDAKAGALGTLPTDPEEADVLIRGRMQEYERQFGGGGGGQAAPQAGPAPVAQEQAPSAQAAPKQEAPAPKSQTFPQSPQRRDFVEAVVQDMLTNGGQGIEALYEQFGVTPDSIDETGLRNIRRKYNEAKSKSNAPNKARASKLEKIGNQF